MRFKTKKLRKSVDFWMFILPALILVTVLIVLPFFMNLYYSFTDWDGISSAPNFIGLQNYLSLLGDKAFWKGPLSFTFRFALVFVILVNAFSLIFAMMFTKGIKTSNILRALFYIPQVISMVMVGYTWMFILGNGFEQLYEKTGLAVFGLSWIGDINLAFWLVVILSIWQQSGFFCVVYIAGLQALPEDVLESAEIDGATGLRKFFHITLPLLMPSVTVCMFSAILNAFKIYDLPEVLTGGGPVRSTTSIAMDIFADSFLGIEYGYGTAKSVVYFVLVILFTMISLGITKKREVEA